MAHWTTEYLEIPFKVHGRDETGLDCWGLVYLIYLEQFGIELPLLGNDYIDLQDKNCIRNLCEREVDNPDIGWLSILPGQEQYGDVFLLPLAGIRIHVAVCVEPGLMIHIIKGAQVIVEEYYEAIWKKRFERGLIYRHPKVII